MDKILLIDKPADWTSFDVVAKIRSEIRKKAKARDDSPIGSGESADESLKKLRVGHAGTLDPFATGLLIVLIGDETKKQSEFMKLDKEYEAVFTLGATSNTDDRTGIISAGISRDLSVAGLEKSEIENSSLNKRSLNTGQDCKKLTRIEIEKALDKFTGEIKQVPPRFSAIKIDGKRAYKLARKDQEFKIEPRIVGIDELKIVKYYFPKLSLHIKCSSGTYIRSLARDFGDYLGCGAYVEDLRRIKIGDYDVADALKIEDFQRDQ